MEDEKPTYLALIEYSSQTGTSNEAPSLNALLR
jgi:hypothetical protein